MLNERKHGISFEEASTAFGNNLSITIEDTLHSEDENRLILIGVLIMKKEYEMLPEYDFSNGIRGKYAKQYKEGLNIVKIDRDISKVFPDTKSVNEALRTLIHLMSINQKNVQNLG